MLDILSFPRTLLASKLRKIAQAEILVFHLSINDSFGVPTKQH